MEIFSNDENDIAKNAPVLRQKKDKTSKNENVTY